MQTSMFHEEDTRDTDHRHARRRPSGLKLTLAGLMAAAVFVAGIAVGSGDGGPTATTAPSPVAAEAAATEPAAAQSLVVEAPATQAPAEDARSAAPLSDASDIGAIVIPSVVTIQIKGGSTIIGSGSGVVYSTSGHIITNAHVVDAGSAWGVVLSDGRIYDATLVGIDSTTDLAVLKVEADGLVPIAIGSTAGLQVGDPAIAVGSPLGLEGGPSLSVGVVSALDRIVAVNSGTTLYGMLQADAPITQGSSGGALVDDRGRLMGITSAVGVSEVGIEGIGFSSPIEIVQRVVDEIIATGQASDPFLGITGSTAFGPTGDGGQLPIGVEVQSVEPGSAAAVAGIVEGDVVTSIAGRPVDTMQDLIGQLRRFSAGDSVRMDIDSNGPRVLQVVLGNR